VIEEALARWVRCRAKNKQEVRWGKEDTVRPGNIFSMEKETKNIN
jgi:hypothetical protein